MIKAIYFLHRKPNFSVEDFQEYWRSKHAPLAARIPGVRRYVQCHTLLSGYKRPTPPPVDGVEEICFDSLEQLAAMETTPSGQAAIADLAHFTDTVRTQHIVTEETIIKAGVIQEVMVKNIELVTRKKGMPIAQFHKYWREIHGPLAAKIRVIERYVQSHTLLSAYEKDRSPAYDGIAETWFINTAAMRQSAKTAEYSTVRADEKNFLSGELPFIITREEKII